MKKIVLSHKGRIGYISGNNAAGLNMFFYEEDGTPDPIEEELQVSATKEEWDNWKETRVNKKFLDKIRKRTIRQLYKKGFDVQADKKMERLSRVK